MLHLNFRKKLNPIKPLQQINLNNEILYMYKEIVQGGGERQRESQREREVPETKKNGSSLVCNHLRHVDQAKKKRSPVEDFNPQDNDKPSAYDVKTCSKLKPIIWLLCNIFL